MQLLDKYNALLRANEESVITRLNSVLDRSFNRLIRRTRIHMRAGYTQPVQRNLAVLQDFRQLIPAFNPNRRDAYDLLFEGLLINASNSGLNVAEQTVRQMEPTRPLVNVDLPLEATTFALKNTKERFKNHGDVFAQEASDIIAQGVLEGRPTSSMVEDSRDRLNIVKSRAATIVRTESLQAYNKASNEYYTRNGVDQVMYYATADDRTCSVCGPRAGNIYKRGEISVPLHPNCRCYLAPWDPDTEKIDENYRKSRLTHKKEVIKALQEAGVVPEDPSTPSTFEQFAPETVSL